jgi:hypothetical protein
LYSTLRLDTYIKDADRGGAEQANQLLNQRLGKYHPDELPGI